MIESDTPQPHASSRDSATPSGSDRDRSAVLSVVAALAFVVILVVWERIVLARIAEPDTALPGFAWHLIGPLGAAGLALLLPPRGCLAVLGTVGSAAGILLAFDIAYHAFFETVPSVFLLSSAGQLLDVHASARVLFSAANIAPLLLFLPFLVLACRPIPGGARKWAASGACPTRRWAAGLLLVGTLVALVAWKTPIYEPTHHIGRDPWVQPADHWGSRYSRLTFATTFGLFNFHVSDLREYLAMRRGRLDLAEEARDRVEGTLEHKHALNARTSPLEGIARGRHVVLLQLESLQHFLLDLEVDGHEVMPNLNRLAREGLRFDYILDVTHVGRTSDAEFAVMTGLLPDVRRPASLAPLDPALVTLPRTLADAGYHTTSIHGYKPSFWNRATSHPAYGIQEMIFGNRFDATDVIGLGPSDRQVFEFAADLLAERRASPQLQLIISLSSHHPYLDVPSDYLAPYRHLHPQAGFGLLGPYLASAAYTDEAIGLYFDRTEANGLLDDTMIVVYGDHDRGGLGGQRPLDEVGPRMFSPTEDRVPLLILVPGREEELARHRASFQPVMGGLHDLFPTIAHLLGEPIPKGVIGTHLFVENAARDALPLPTPPGAFGYRGALSLGAAGVVVSDQAARGAEDVPPLEHAMRDRLVVEDLLDHYAEIAATWPDSAPHQQALANASRIHRGNPAGE